MEEATRTPLASFEAKWQGKHPEFGMAMRFVGPRDRAAQAAFRCLVFELEQAAFATRDAEPAAVKLQWWAEELTRAGQGEARHPLTLALAAHPALSGLPVALWYAAIRGALAQRDPEPAADGEAVFGTYALLFDPLGRVSSALFGTEAGAVAAALALSRAVQEIAGLPETLRAGRLPLPLDLLARHRLARGDLSGHPGARAALCEWIDTWQARCGSVLHDRGAAGPLAAASAAATAARARRAVRTADPARSLRDSLGRIPPSAVWAAWRSGRRSRG